MRGGSSRSARLAAAVLVLAAALVGPIAQPTPAYAAECNVKPGIPDPGTVPWAQKRLDIADVWPITQGAHVTVAVVDSGVDQAQPQMAQIHYAPGVRVIPGGSGPNDTTDCVGHGTSVAGIVAAPKVLNVGFTGVAPQATIMPIEVTNTQAVSAGALAQGIDAAVAAHVQVINVSSFTTSDVPQLRAAVGRAERAGIVVVAAASETPSGGGGNAPPIAYPAAYPTVLAVSATDSQDNPGNFIGTGSYIDLAAPGAKVQAPWPSPSLDRGYTVWDGTSFATPYVSGVVALVLATHPGLTPAQVRNRLEATADPPPGKAVPSPAYGYGIVNPYLAVTAVRDDSKLASAAGQPPVLPPAARKPPADRHLQHLALAVGTALLGLAVLAGLIAAVIRRGSWFGRGTPASASGEQRARQTADIG